MADSTSNAEHDGQTYEPGPSFLRNDRPDVRLAELPAWLQTFASSVGEPELGPEPAEEPALPGHDPAHPEPEATAEDVPDEIESEVEADEVETEQEGVGLPGWLEEPRQGQPSPSDQGDDTSFMISEDDLPEWLRTISPAQQQTPAASREPSTTGEETKEERFGSLGIPSVARVWVTNGSNSLSDGGSLFALVASQASSGAMMSSGSEEAPASSNQSSSFKTDSLGATKGTEQPGKLTTEATLASDESSSGSNMLRIVLLVAVIIILLLFIAMTQLG